MDEATLNRLAAEALIEEARIGAKRAEILGPSGWVKPNRSINKRFLHSTLRNVVLSNRKRMEKKNCSKPSTSNEEKLTIETNKKRRNT